MHAPLADNDVVSTAQLISADFAISQCSARDCPSRRIETGGLFDDPFGVGQSGHVCGFGHASTEDLLQFFMKLLFNFRCMLTR